MLIYAYSCLLLIPVYLCLFLSSLEVKSTAEKVKVIEMIQKLKQKMKCSEMTASTSDTAALQYILIKGTIHAPLLTPV